VNPAFASQMIILTKKGRNEGNKGKYKKALPSLPLFTSFLRVNPAFASQMVIRTKKQRNKGNKGKNIKAFVSFASSFLRVNQSTKNILSTVIQNLISLLYFAAVSTI